MSVVGTAIPDTAETRIKRGAGLNVAPVIYISLLVAVCKLAFYIADPYPSFHFGDSGAVSAMVFCCALWFSEATPSGRCLRSRSLRLEWRA